MPRTPLGPSGSQPWGWGGCAAQSQNLCAWPRGPVVRVSVKQTYLPKGRAAGGSGAGAGAGRGSPQCPGLWQGHKAPTSGFSGQSGGVTGCAHTSPCPPTVFHPYVSPLPAFHTYPSGSQPPRLPSCQPRCLARLSHLPPSSDGACSGEPPGEVLLSPAPHKGRFGGQSCLPITPAHCTVVWPETAWIPILALYLMAGWHQESHLTSLTFQVFICKMK